MSALFSKRVGLFLGGAIPIQVTFAAVMGSVSYDFALSAISVMFSVALIPGIIENQRAKRGWSQQSTVTTGSGLLSMGTMFVMLGLTFTGLLTIVSGSLWVVLAAQAFVFAPKVNKALVLSKSEEL